MDLIKEVNIKEKIVVKQHILPIINKINEHIKDKNYFELELLINETFSKHNLYNSDSAYWYHSSEEFIISTLSHYIQKHKVNDFIEFLENTYNCETIIKEAQRVSKLKGVLGNTHKFLTTVQSKIPEYNNYDTKEVNGADIFFFHFKRCLFDILELEYENKKEI